MTEKCQNMYKCILYKEIVSLIYNCALVGCNENKDSTLLLVSPTDQLHGHAVSVHNSATICNTVIISSTLCTSYTLFKDYNFQTMVH